MSQLKFEPSQKCLVCRAYFTDYGPTKEHTLDGWTGFAHLSCCTDLTDKEKKELEKYENKKIEELKKLASGGETDNTEIDFDSLIDEIFETSEEKKVLFGAGTPAFTPDPVDLTTITPDVVDLTTITPAQSPLEKAVTHLNNLPNELREELEDKYMQTDQFLLNFHEFAKKEIYETPRERRNKRRRLREKQ